MSALSIFHRKVPLYFVLVFIHSDLHHLIHHDDRGFGLDPQLLPVLLPKKRKKTRAHVNIVLMEGNQGQEHVNKPRNEAFAKLAYVTFCKKLIVIMQGESVQTENITELVLNTPIPEYFVREPATMTYPSLAVDMIFKFYKKMEQQPNGSDCIDFLFKNTLSPQIQMDENIRRNCANVVKSSIETSAYQNPFWNLSKTYLSKPGIQATNTEIGLYSICLVAYFAIYHSTLMKLPTKETVRKVLFSNPKTQRSTLEIGYGHPVAGKLSYYSVGLQEDFTILNVFSRCVVILASIYVFYVGSKKRDVEMKNKGYNIMKYAIGRDPERTERNTQAATNTYQEYCLGEKDVLFE